MICRFVRNPHTITDSGFRTLRCFPKCSWADVVISFTEWCWFLMQCSLKDRRSPAFNVDFRPCRLHAKISPDSLLMTSWTVDYEIPKFLAIVHWETLFLNCWTICSHSCSQSGEPHPILASERLSLSGMLLLYPNMTLTYFQLTCSPVECSKQGFFGHSSTSPVFCCPGPSFYRTCCRHQIQIEWIFPKKLKVYQFEHYISCLCSVLNKKIGQKGFSNHCIQF